MKYLGVVKVTGKVGSVIECEWVSDGKTNKPKGWITWISSVDATKAKVNLYKNLLTEADLNKVEHDWMN